MAEGDGADAAAAAAAASAAAAAAAAAAATQATAWTKDVAPELLETWTSKKYDLTDPKKVAIEATRAYKAAESVLGGDPNLIVKLPKSPTEPGWDKVWSKLGAPDKPEGYDFTSIKGADGKELPQSLVDMLRKTASETHIPKDAATQIAAAITKYNDDLAATGLSERQATVTKEKEALKANWGKDFDAKLFAAKQAATALGVTVEQLNALQNQVGYDGVMNMFLKISTSIGEDKLVQGDPLGGRPGLITKVEAEKKLAALRADKNWGLRLTQGDVAAKAESAALAAIINGDDTVESRARAGK